MQASRREADSGEGHGRNVNDDGVNVTDEAAAKIERTLGLIVTRVNGQGRVERGEAVEMRTFSEDRSRDAETVELEKLGDRTSHRTVSHPVQQVAAIGCGTWVQKASHLVLRGGPPAIDCSWANSAPLVSGIKKAAPLVNRQIPHDMLTGIPVLTDPGPEQGAVEHRSRSRRCLQPTQALPQQGVDGQQMETRGRGRRGTQESVEWSLFVEWWVQCSGRRRQLSEESIGCREFLRNDGVGR
ncbi:MAG: hypothetical protein M3256_11635 [Actinomycetota bacterium]|nr:hypothetical protein [Actinomycetota bacterium]